MISQEERAKQFMPFAALTGYDDVLRQKERIYVAEPELSDDMKEEIDRTLHELVPGMMVELVFYSDGAFEKVVGMVSKILPEKMQIIIVKRAVSIENIYSLKLLRND